LGFFELQPATPLREEPLLSGDKKIKVSHDVYLEQTQKSQALHIISVTVEIRLYACNISEDQSR
jgi:hypothetical protein